MEDAYGEAYPDLYRRHWWWRAREEILLRKVARALQQIPSARILDIGCGAGLFFDALQRFGHVEGIESDPSAVANAGVWRDRIVLGELDARFSPTEPYDLILMLDVLEHIPDPVQLLRHAGRLLKPDGRVLVTVPAFQWLWTAHDDLNHHLRRYTARQITRVVEDADLIVDECTYLFQSLVAGKLLVRAREAMRGAQPEVPRVPPAAVNRLLKGWLVAEFGVARWLPFGASLMVVARR